MSPETHVAIPKRGDHVAIAEQEGTFEVDFVNSLMQTVNVKSTDGTGHITRNVAWTLLKPLARK
jgi:hypothetical protein